MRNAIRDALPVPVRRLVRGSATYAQRLLLWHTILRQVKGAGPADREALRYSALAAPWTARKALTAWRDPVLLRDATVEVPGVGRFAVRAGTDELYIVLPAREHALIAAMRRLLGPGKVCVDAGANIGAATVLARRLVGSEGRVIAIEMMPDTAARLRASLALNGYEDVTVVEAALASTAGRQVTASVQAGHAGRATLAMADQLEAPRTVTVTTRRLADILENVPRIDFLKLDLEGVELDALRGAEPVLDRVAAIAFEQLEGTETADWLAARGFAIEEMDPRNFLARRRSA